MPVPEQILVIHERIGNWARQLRPRLADQSARVVETRSGDDLAEALQGHANAYPIVLIDLGRRLRASVEDLERVRKLAPEALILVLDPTPHAGLAQLARELGASQVLRGPVTPPAVADLLRRWLSLAQRRAEGSGWMGTAPPPPEPEPRNWLSPWLSATP